MSSGAVRQAFEDSWSTLMPGLPLHLTISEEPDRSTLPATWATVDYLGGADPQVSLGTSACWRESGTILVVVYGKSGIGDNTVISNADSVRDAYRDWKSGTIQVTQADPGEGGSASDGRWFAASVSLTYQYDRFI